MNLLNIIDQVAETASKAGAFIKKESQNFDTEKVEQKKGFSDLVSYVDKTAEKLIVEDLRKIDPSIGFVAEEGTGERADGWNWIIDPLDGTTNFIHGVPAYCVSIGLAFEDEVRLGVIYDIPQDDCFTAVKGNGAFCNGKPIRVSASKNMNSSLIATGFPYYEFSKLDNYMESLKVIMQNSRGIRRMGSAAIDLAYTACGRFDAFFEFNLNAWDVGAGIILVQEAGGVVTDFQGGNDCLFGRSLVCGNPKVYRELLEVVGKI